LWSRSWRKRTELPVIKGVIHTTETLTKVMGTPNKFAHVLRDAFTPMVSHLAGFQHAFVSEAF
jgi:hypothetical protein